MVIWWPGPVTSTGPSSSDRPPSRFKQPCPRRKALTSSPPSSPWPRTTLGRAGSSVPALRLDQIVEQLGLGVDRVMSEGSLYDRDLAALAIKQAQGDLM